MANEAAETNAQIKKTVVEELGRRKESQSALATRMGVTRSHISQVISGGRAEVPDSLIKLLDALDLELVVQPKKQLQ